MKNVGGVDRIIRIVVGLAIIAWGAYEQNWLGGDWACSFVNRNHSLVSCLSAFRF